MAGIIVAGFAKSGLGLLKYFADSENGELESIVYWELGSLAKVSWEQVAVIAPLIIGIFAVLFLIRRRLTCLAFGESAGLLGIHVSGERVIAIALASLLVSLSTAICGIISWVSLIIPIAASELTGSGSFSDNLTITALLGSVFLLISDTVARTSTTSEIPISIITGTAGLIVFCIAVFSKKERHRI
jgi:iron complex transport system permease protein